MVFASDARRFGTNDGAGGPAFGDRECTLAEVEPDAGHEIGFGVGRADRCRLSHLYEEAGGIVKDRR